MVGYANPKCYARELGDCSQQISREHYISKALIARMESIGIAGFGFQEPGTIKTVGLQSVVSKILCQKHNSDLSPLDHEAGDLFAALRRFDADLHEDVERPEQEHVLLSGALLERWLLKVLAGLVHGGTVGSSRLRSGFPWLRILFGLEGWPEGTGFGAYVPLAQHAFEGIEIETATVGEEAWGTTFDLAGVSL